MPTDDGLRLLLVSCTKAITSYNYRMDTDFDIKFYRERWKAVEEIERQELRASTVQTNWRQLNSILCRSIRLGFVRGDDDGEAEVFNRWAVLRRLYESA